MKDILTNTFKRSMGKAIIPMVKDNLPKAEKALMDYIKNIPLEEGEAQTAIMIYDYYGELYLSVATLTTDNRISRQVEIKPLLPFVETLISQL